MELLCQTLLHRLPVAFPFPLSPGPTSARIVPSQNAPLGFFPASLSALLAVYPGAFELYAQPPCFRLTQHPPSV